MERLNFSARCVRRRRHDSLYKMGFFLLLFAVVALAMVSRTSTCKQEIQYKFQDHCCPLCHIGSFKVRDCEASGKETVCDLCTPGTYMDEPNHSDRCMRCRECDAVAGFVVAKNCSNKLNTECRCRDGMYVNPHYSGICLHCHTCQQGHKTTQPCTPLTDTECAPCLDGEYSDGHNCLSCLRCEDQHLETEQPCRPNSNTQCKKHSNMLVIVVTVSLLCLFIVIIVVMCMKKKSPRSAFSDMWNWIVKLLGMSPRSLPPIPPSIPLLKPPNCNLIPGHFHYIIEDVPDAGFMPLMRHLGVANHKIEEIEYNHPHDRNEQKYQILSSWFNSKEFDVEWSVVLKGLQHMGDWESYNRLMKRLVQGSPSVSMTVVESAFLDN
ncbi:tumor necrosis factor receptor superfamily member 6-like [Petromyzon marinus]|uniref:Tumor necrosis factor receptor superfamily member 6 n=1 Tax=Petromyzon marinus TaxID=7757 RepID=A0AAJ7TYB9_PETMA|nr:tumor necrosis factor receptor superfamily member 6-like [Petromyzon marinus]